jgi:hypothetical protein
MTTTTTTTTMLRLDQAMLVEQDMLLWRLRPGQYGSG